MDLSHPQGVDGALTIMAAPQEIVDESAAFDALDFEAPYLLEKLLKDHIVDSAEQGGALFTEVKRYLVLNNADPTKAWKMYSLRVDEAWHQFVLFTVEYSAFCDKYFGHYAHHAPSNAPDPGFGHRAPEATFAEFADRYRKMFGVELPDVWDDSTSVTPRRRIVNELVGQLKLGAVDDMIDLIGRDGRVFVERQRDRAGRFAIHCVHWRLLRSRATGGAHRRRKSCPDSDFGRHEAAPCRLTATFRRARPSHCTVAITHRTRLWSRPS